MTKAKALKLMWEKSRCLIDPSLAKKIAQAFGYTLSNLGLTIKPAKDWYRSNFSEETAELSSVAVYQLAENLAQQFNKEWKAPMPFHGHGSNTEHATEKSIEEIKKHL